MSAIMAVFPCSPNQTGWRQLRSCSLAPQTIGDEWQYQVPEMYDYECLTPYEEREHLQENHFTHNELLGVWMLKLSIIAEITYCISSIVQHNV